MYRCTGCVSECLRELAYRFDEALLDPILSDNHEQSKAILAFGLLTKEIEDLCSTKIDNGTKRPSSNHLYNLALRILKPGFGQQSAIGSIFLSLGDLSLDYLSSVSGIVLLCRQEAKYWDYLGPYDVGTLERFKFMKDLVWNQSGKVEPRYYVNVWTW